MLKRPLPGSLPDRNHLNIFMNQLLLLLCMGASVAFAHVNLIFLEFSSEHPASPPMTSSFFASALANVKPPVPQT